MNRYNLAQILTTEERFNEAINQYDKILLLDKLNPEARRNRAWNNIILDNNEKARKDLEFLLSIGQLDLDGYQLLGSTYKEDEPEKALKYYLEAFEIEKRDYVCLEILECYEMLGNKEGLIKYLSLGIDLKISKEKIEYYTNVLGK